MGVPMPNLSASATSGAQAGSGATKIVTSGGTDNLNRALNLWAGTAANGGYPVSGGVAGFSLDRPGFGASLTTPFGGVAGSIGLLAGAALVGYMIWKKKR